FVAALGLALFARPGVGGSYWSTFFPAMVVAGLGMSVVVAPLTTTGMNAVEAQHAGIASGVNNAASRVAGLVASAVLGIVLVSGFQSSVGQTLDRITLTSTERAAVDRELPRLAGAEIDSRWAPDRRAEIRRTIDDAFVSAFRVVMLTAAAVAACAG